MNTDLELIAQKIIYNVKNKKDNFGFVITILMVISIVLTLIRITQECNKDKTKLFSSNEKSMYYKAEMESLSIRKGWFTKMMIKKTIRKELGKDTYQEYGYELMNAILQTGENITEDEIITLMEATNV